MTRRQRTSALVALSLLTSAAMAHDECAWVLWVESHFTSLSSNSSGPSKWESVDGLATGQACKEARRLPSMCQSLKGETPLRQTCSSVPLTQT